MNKGIIYCASALLLIILSSSCKRKHECFCTITGQGVNTTLNREYRGYSKAEARILCQSEEYGSSATIDISCVLLR